MADAITIQELIDARTDAKTLEQAVNGDAVTTVLSRLGETYPSLSNALNQIDSKLDSADAQVKQGITNLFENGGLPAVPFATKALMTASALADGQYAMVTNDTVNNGLYVKTAGAWVKSNYDPLEQAKNYTDDSILQNSDDILTLVGFRDDWVDITYTTLTNRIVLTEFHNPVSSPRSGVDSIKISVTGLDKLRISGNGGSDEWYTVFTDENFVRISDSPNSGVGEYDVPEGAVFAYRTIKSPSFDAVGFKLEGYLGVLNPITVLTEDVENLKADVEAISGNSVANVSRIKKMEEAFAQGDMLKISDFTGSTQHAQIDNAIAFIKQRGWGILDLESGTWMRSSAILLPDNCWLYLNNATVQLVDGVFDNVIRNDGVVPNPDPFKIASEINRNVNIRVFGNGIASSAVNASAVTYTAPHPVTGGEPIPYLGDAFGWRTISVYLVNVKGYKLHDFRINNSKCWSISQEHGNEDFEVYNIDIQSIGVKNGDGVDVRFGCKNGSIYNITGRVGDDIVALTALARTAPRTFPDGNYLYPMHAGGYIDSGNGIDITDIDVYNISGRGQHNGVRLLASNASKLQRISVSNVSDADGGFDASLVLVSSGYGTAAPMGAISDITINGVASTNSGKALKIDGNIKDSIFNNITQANASKLLVDDTATKENVVITNARRV